MSYRFRFLASWVVTFAVVTALPGFGAEEGFSLMRPLGTAREYYTSNKDNRFLIKVQVWGDSPLPGIHYIPDNTTLLELLGYAGGVGGSDYASSKITLAHTSLTANDGPSEMRVSGDDLFKKPDVRNTRLKNGDVIHIEAGGKSDTFMKTVGVISAILSVVAAAAALYLVAKKN